MGHFYRDEQHKGKADYVLERQKEGAGHIRNRSRPKRYRRPAASGEGGGQRDGENDDDHGQADCDPNLFLRQNKR